MSRPSGRDVLGVALALTLTQALGCLTERQVTCADGTVCASPRVCAPVTPACVDPAQIEACEGKAEGEPCELALGDGRCRDQVCVAGGCGDGVTDLDEVCDDGNQTSGDGCRADCAKVEVCGDAIVDAGEACDDGNANPADGCTDACGATTWAATALAGANLAATEGAINFPVGVEVGADGRIYIADTSNHQVKRVEGDGTITLIAGTGVAGFSGDGGPATSAQLFNPFSVAVDGLGRVFIADASNNRIRRIDQAGMITTIAGTGAAGYAGDGGPATNAALQTPASIAVDGLGQIAIADLANHRIRQIDVDGIITTIAGTGVEGDLNDGELATTAQLSRPYGVAHDPDGRLVIADWGNHRIRRLDDDGVLRTIAGVDPGGPDGGYGGDGGPALAAQLNHPTDIGIDADGRIYIGDTFNFRIRRVDTDGTMTTVAGNGDNYYYGDDGPATAAALAYPQGVAVDPDGRVVFCDTNNLRIRTVDDDGDIQTLAGTGSPRYSGDGGAATSALLSRPASLATDSQGRMVFSDRLNNRIWRVARDGTIESVAGRGVAEFGGDGGPATEAYVRLPMGLAIDSQDRIVFADGSNHRIRRIDTDGIITTIAGTGAAGFAGDDGPGTLAQLQFPTGLAVDADGRVLFTDWGNHRIRRIDTDGTITTIVGTGVGGFSGDGGPAALAQVDRPFGLTVDADGHVFIADTYNQRVRVIDTAGDIHTFAGVGTSGAAGDGGDALAAQLSLPFDVATDADGGVYIADAGNHRVRRVDAAGTISTVAGTGALGFVGDGGPATAAALYDVGGVAIGLDGEVLLADTRNNRIRRIDDGVITTIAGQVDPPRMGPLARAQLATPTALTITPAFTLIAGGTSGTVQRVRPDAAVLEVVAGRYPHTPGTGALARFRDVTFGAVGGVAWDPVGAQLYLTETTNHVIHVVTPVDPNDPSTWTIATLAGAAGAAAFADGALATARFRDPTGLWLDVDARRLYVADTGNHVVRAIDLDRATVATVAGTPATRGYFGDDGAATDALLFAPEAVVGCPGGDLFVADTGNHRIRRVATATGLITSVLGDGVAASSGEGTPANIFPVDAPRGLACDDLGNLFVASTATIRLLAADDDGVVDGSGAVSTIYGLPPRDESPANLTRCIAGVAVRDAEAVQLVDSCVGLLVELTRQPLP